MTTRRVLTAFFLSAAIFGVLTGCSNRQASQRVEIPDLGFSMELPGGWWSTSFNPNFFFVVDDPENCFGGVDILPSNGLSLTSFVDSQIKMEKKSPRTREQTISGDYGYNPRARAKKVSRTSRVISGVDSVELVMSRDGFHIFTIWLDRGEEIVKVEFHVPDEKFPRWQGQLVAAGKSITLR